VRARTFILAAVLFTVGIFVTGTFRENAVAWSPSAIAERSGLAETLKRLPRHFEEHRDADGRVRFVSRTPESTVVLSGDGAALALPEARPVRMRLAGGNPSPDVVPSEELTGKTHYLIGSDPAKWRTDVKTFAKVRVARVYPGVDLVYYARGRELEYDFIVAPAADPARISLQFEGVDSLALDADGGLRLRIGSRDIRMEPPHLYQEAANGRQTIDGRYLVDGPRAVRFAVGAYDRDRRLVIDPVVTYSTYFGGGGEDVVTGIAVDDAGFIYFTGTTPTFASGWPNLAVSDAMRK